MECSVIWVYRIAVEAAVSPSFTDPRRHPLSNTAKRARRVLIIFLRVMEPVYSGRKFPKANRVVYINIFSIKGIYKRRFDLFFYFLNFHCFLCIFLTVCSLQFLWTELFFLHNQTQNRVGIKSKRVGRYVSITKWKSSVLAFYRHLVVVCE